MSTPCYNDAEGLPESLQVDANRGLMTTTANQTTVTASRLQTSYDELRSLIIEGVFAPGTRLLETEIADRLGVSRATAQSALKRLHHEGIIRRPSGNRAPWIVAPLTIRGFREVVDVLLAATWLAARRAAELDSDEREKLADELRAINEEFREIGSELPVDTDRVDELDWRFHCHLVDRMVSARLREVYHSQHPLRVLYGRQYARGLGNRSSISVHNHAAIIDAIEQGDADAADLATRLHWSGACERFEEVIAQIGEQGTM
jgi:DNA-binding GntR family transcriptional regulator